MAFDFSNIKAKGKLNGLSFYSSVSDNDSVHEIPLDLIDSFEGHPFSVIDNDDMIQLTESVKHNGIMNPAIVREKGSGRYELISGHRRKRACELVGLETLKAYVKQLTDEEATIIMVDSNLQREKILPSERAFAYKMKYEVLKKSVGRPSTDKLSPVATKAVVLMNKSEICSERVRTPFADTFGLHILSKKSVIWLMMISCQSEPQLKYLISNRQNKLYSYRLCRNMM